MGKYEEQSSRMTSQSSKSNRSVQLLCGGMYCTKNLGEHVGDREVILPFLSFLPSSVFLPPFAFVELTFLLSG